MQVVRSTIATATSRARTAPMDNRCGRFLRQLKCCPNRSGWLPGRPFDGCDCLHLRSDFRLFCGPFNCNRASLHYSGGRLALAIFSSFPPGATHAYLQYIECVAAHIAMDYTEEAPEFLAVALMGPVGWFLDSLAMLGDAYSTYQACTRETWGPPLDRSPSHFRVTSNR